MYNFGKSFLLKLYLLSDLENFDEKFLTTINHEQSLLLLAKNYRENDVKIGLQIFQNWSKSSQNDRLSSEMLVKVIVETQGGVHQKFSKLFTFSIFFFRRKNWVICFDHENWTENENKQVSECKGLSGTSIFFFLSQKKKKKKEKKKKIRIRRNMIW